MSRYFPPTKTPATPEQAFASFRRAVPTLGADGLCVLVAHWALETGSGTRMCAWNIGGAKATVGGAHDWTFLTTHEVEAGVSVKYSAPPLDMQPNITAESLRAVADKALVRRIRTTCFRAYESFDVAVADHVALIRKRFAPAWPHVVAGNPQMYGLTLGALRYYTAPRDQYAAALAAHHARFLRQSATWKADA